MNKKIFSRIIVLILMFITIFNTSLSYAASYAFTSGTNTVSATEFVAGYTFKVPETGVYSITLLPVVEGYEWEYDLRTFANKDARRFC